MDESTPLPELEIDRYAPMDWYDHRHEVEYNGLWATKMGVGPALLVLHGFTEDKRIWARHWFDGTVVAVDLPGHGKSKDITDPQRYTMQQTVAELLGLMDKLGFERFAVMGYSMGGRIALHLTATAPKRVVALILESASPGLADPAERVARVAADEALAQRMERDGVSAFLTYWNSLPLFAEYAPEPIRLDQDPLVIEEEEDTKPTPLRDRWLEWRRENSSSGLASSLRGMGTGSQQPLWDLLHNLKMPVLLMAGEHDEKFVNIARRMAVLLPQATLLVVADAGHRIHGTHNTNTRIRYWSAVELFLAKLTRWIEVGE